MSNATTTDRRDWNWDRDGVLDGHYVETRQLPVKKGPNAGKLKLVFDFHVGPDDELVTVWETTVIRSKLREELQRRGKPDFDLGERFTITPTGTKGANNYLDFEIAFEHAAPKKTTAELLGAEAEPAAGSPPPSSGDEFPANPEADDDIPF
jgi:hypothetical protein